MDSKGKATAPTPPYRQDAKKGYLPLDDLPYAGSEPSSYAPWGFLKGNSLERQIRVTESQRYKPVTSKAANDVQVRELVPASDKRSQGLQASEPQEFNMVWDNGYLPERAQWVYKQFGGPVPRMWHNCQFCEQ